MLLNDVVRCILLAFTLWGIYRANAVREDEMVDTWAGKLGDELWELGTTVTKSPEIRTSYTKLNARVLPTDGEGILNSILHNVGRLLKQKMDSLKCIISNAEFLSQNLTREEVEETGENYTYYHSIYSGYTGKEAKNISIQEEGSKEEEGEEEEEEEDEDPLKEYAKQMEKKYLYMDIEQNTDFFGIDVNTSFSSVHVPHYIYDKGEDTLHSIMWSQGLDEDFVNNYESDSTMAWQYFCSSTGFLRHFPAYHWPDSQEDFDCRTRIWYTEAATCPKEVVIMMDRSGSMIGVKKTIAKAVVQTVLQTLSNNDLLNIFVFNKTVKHVVECFPNDTLVQATPENLKMFDLAINKTVYEDKLFLEPALTWAFTVLENTKRTCLNAECTQVVILITDGIAENVTHIFQKYNWIKNNTVDLPARLFVFVVGKDASSEDLAKNMACLNRGHYAPIKHMEEVREQVLKYIPFLAKPDEAEDLDQRSLSWSHMFVDATGLNEEDEEQNRYRMMTSVIGPAFQWTDNSNQEQRATLLGVAGIDVLIEDIKKLTLPYKIGANGYAFLITNNGHVIFHPDHRPVEFGILKDNYNSFDLSEVELFDDNETEPRLPNEKIIQLREAMVLHKYGRMEGVHMKFHYDQMRRVGVEARHYYYAPLNNTPFALGLVLPHSYGSYWIKAGDEIKKSIQMGVPLADHFRGNWRIHPKWVYCDYHRTKLEFSSQEEKLVHFLEKMFNIHEWKWKDQFDVYNPENSDISQCGEKEPIKEDDYYCDKDLMQLLVFDAKVTENSYKDPDWSAKTRREEELVKQFGVSVRFVATQSGLTRWQPVPSHPYAGEFGTGKFSTLEETWYKSAVLFHQTDPDAFVYSVPFQTGSQSDPLLTASYAIFPRDGGNEAPGSVVGFQMLHSVLVERFKDITSKVQSFDSMETCASDVLDCYIIDSNGYIIVSEGANDTGRFFGEYEGAVMESMVAKNIFRKIPMFDYQGICFPESGRNSGIDFLKTPFDLLKQAGTWFLAKLLWLIISTNQLMPVYAQMDAEENLEILLETVEDNKATKVKDEEEEEIKAESCDRSGMLYLLEPESEELPYTASTNCSRPFYVKRIPKTNLLLIVVNTLYQSCYRKLSTSMDRINYDKEGYDEPGCHKLGLNTLTRRKPSPCYIVEPQDLEAPRCGAEMPTSLPILFAIMFCTLHRMIY